MPAPARKIRSEALPSLISSGALMLYGIIGDDVTARAVVDAVSKLSGPIVVRINSPGGSLTEGVAIYNTLRNSGRRVIVRVDGAAYSAASLIAMAGDEIVMAEGATMMLHDPWASITGSSADMRQTADAVDLQRDQMISIYAARSGLAREEIKAMMASETYLDAHSACERGFATAVAAPVRIAAMSRLSPDELARFMKEDIEMVAAAAAPPPAALVAAQTAERERITEIGRRVRLAHLPQALADQLITDKVPLATACDQIVEAWTAKMEAEDPGTPHFSQLRIGDDFTNPAFQAKALADAVYAKIAGTRAAGPSAELASLTLVDLGRLGLEARGERGLHKLSRHALADRVMASTGYITTSDLPNTLLAGIERYLKEQFQAAASPLAMLAFEREVADFRPYATVQLSESPELREVVEHGEIEHAGIDENAVTNSIGTFAIIFAFTRQAIINDDLGAVQRHVQQIGTGAALTEARKLAALFTANGGLGATMQQDGVPLYDAAHGNLAAAAALSVDTLGASRKLMRQQLGLDKTTPIGFAPRVLLVGPALETAGEKLITQITPMTAETANPFAQRLTLAVEPRFGDSLAWRLFADPKIAPCIEIAHLRGSGGTPIVEQRQGWNILGAEYRVIHDFGCKLIEWRGTTLNVGA
jgi:ATP-dependent protease ClpP protease subunit